MDIEEVAAKRRKDYRDARSVNVSRTATPKDLALTIAGPTNSVVATGARVLKTRGNVGTGASLIEINPRSDRGRTASSRSTRNDSDDSALFRHPES